MDDTTIVDGDFAIIEHQRQPVLKALFKGTPTSLPSINTRRTRNRAYFLPLSGRDPAKMMAQNGKDALALTVSK
jgi:hypothetical protein